MTKSVKHIHCKAGISNTWAAFGSQARFVRPVMLYWNYKPMVYQIFGQGVSETFPLL